MYSKVVREFCSYIKRNRYVIAILTFFVCLLHSDKLSSVNSGIDTEKIIFAGGDIYRSWLGIGRQGLVFLKWMMGQLSYNPYFAGILTLLFLVMAVIAFCFLFEYIRRGAGKGSLLLTFGMLLTAHPVLTEQLYFSLQGAEITFSFLLCAVSLFCAHHWAEKRGGCWFVSGVLLLLPAFSVYQAMVPLYLFGIVAVCLLYGLRTGQETEGGNASGIRKEMQYLFHLMTVFLLSLTVNQLITLLFFSKSDYLGKQIQWEASDMGEGVRRILAHVRDVVLGQGIFYSWIFFWLALGLLVLYLLRIRKNFAPELYGWNLFLLAALYASPFYLTILMGERPVIRGQLVLPFMTGFMAYLGGVLVQDMEAAREQDYEVWKKQVVGFWKGYLMVVCLLALWQEAEVTCRLYYTDAVRYQEDLWLAGNLEQDIIRFTGQCYYDGPVVFVGKRSAAGNEACLTGDVMGQSLFAWDTGVEPQNYWSSSRIIGFMHCLGARYKEPNTNQVRLASRMAESMPCYPAQGSIVWCKDVLVVKLS